ncbi:MAG TPA: transglycosylase SLT domain-containing protein [Anaerolineales bacterium]|nr:transglycosylase SLT domain-containing protein [Anaerolineales bacterium]
MASLNSNRQMNKAGRSLIFITSLFLLVVLISIPFLFKIDPPIPFEKQPINDRIAPFFSNSVQFWNEDIQAWAAEYDLDPNLIATVMQIESCGNPSVISSAGAMGLFQVMPFHFLYGEDPFDPTTNALRGLTYLSDSMYLAGQNPNLGLAGYNGGVGVIQWSSDQWYDETQRYVYWGSRILEDANANLTQSSAYDEWYGSYGYWMCEDARSQLGLIP